MSTEHRLTVSTPDPLAEISVHDGAFREVGRAVGRYAGDHPPGLYEIAVRAAGSVETRLVSLDQDRAESFGEVRFLSPAPASRATGAEDWDRIAAELAGPERMRQHHRATAVLVVGQECSAHRSLHAQHVKNERLTGKATTPNAAPRPVIVVGPTAQVAVSRNSNVVALRWYSAKSR